VVYAETADDLLAYWIPQYQGADSAGRARLRAEHALQIRPNIIAGLIVTADQEGTEFSDQEEEILTMDLSNLPADLRTIAARAGWVRSMSVMPSSTTF